METGSESNSAKSVAGTPTSSLKSPSTPHTPGWKKQVGFTRPTLIIPPPQARGMNPSIYSASAAIGPTPNNVYDRKASAFMFDQINGIRGFTKSGLGLGEKCAYWLYNKVRSWSRKWFTHMFLTIVLLLYTIGGALVFEFIEGHNEKKVVEVDLRSKRYELIRELRNLSIYKPLETSIQEWEGSASSRLIEYETYIIDFNNKHKLLMGNKERKWTFLNAAVYCGTIYTTIGYGHIYPETKTGKTLTIVYAIIGIPLFLLALTDFGKLFTRCIKFFWSFVRRLYYTGSCRRVRKTAHVEEFFKGAQMMYEIATFRRPSAFVADVENANQPPPEGSVVGDDTPTTPAISNFEIDDEFNLPISLAIFILIIYILCGGLIYCLWESWGFFDSFYFVFISMSTIGFGDMVPDNPVCMIVSIVYLVFGLALTSMCINVVQTKLSDTFKQASTKIGATIGLEVGDDGSILTVPPENVEIPEVHDPKNLDGQSLNSPNGTNVNESKEE